MTFNGEQELPFLVLQRYLEAIGVAALVLGQCFEQVRDLVKTLLTRGLSHTRVHIGVLVILTGD